MRIEAQQVLGTVRLGVTSGAPHPMYDWDPVHRL